MKVVTRALVCAFLFGLIVSWGGVNVPTLAAAPTLPPTWTPEPTSTPFQEPTIVPLPTDNGSSGPTLVPTITPRPMIREDLFLTAPLYFISKRFSDTRFIAQSLPNEGDFHKLVKLDTENVIAFDVCKDGKLIYATDTGMIYAAGRSKPWKSPTKTTKPMLVSTIVCSLDSKTIAFGLRADEADFAKMGKTPTSGVYLWGAAGDPQLIIPDHDQAADKTQLRANYDVMSWSPDGKLLLVNFNAGADKPTDGLGLWTVASKEYKDLYRYASADKLRYKDALWLRDSSAMLLFNIPSTNKNQISPITYLTVEGTRTQVNLFLPKANTTGGTPTAISAVRFLPDGRVVLLGAVRVTDNKAEVRSQPLQLFVGRYDNLARIEIEPVGTAAFRLDWPGTLLMPPSGFPVYILDQHFGVQLFNSGRIIAFLPQEMRMGSLNNTDAFGDEFFPSYRFGPATVTLPTR